MVATAPRDRRRAARLPGVRRAARCSSRTTRRSTSASSRPPRAHRATRGRPTPCWTPARLARRASPATRSQLQAGHAGRALPRHGHPEPPGAVRRARHRGRAARADRPAGHPACTPGGAGHLLRPVPAERRASGTWPRDCPARPGSTCSRTPRGGCCTSARRPTCAPGCAATSPPASMRRRMREMVGLAERVRPVVCATVLEARGARAAADRRAQAALQPPLAVPRAEPWVQADRRAVPAAVGGARGPADGDRARPTWAASGRGGRAEAVEALHEDLRRCGSAPPGCRAAPGHGGPARWPGWAAAVRRAPAASSPRSTPALASGAARRCSGTPARVVAHHAARIAALVGARAVRGGGRACATGSRRSCAARARLQRLARAGRRRRGRRGRARTTGGWEIVVVRHGRLAAAGGRRAARTRGRSRRAAGHRRAWSSGRCRPGRGGHRRGDRARAALAGVAGGAAGRGRGGLGLPASRGAESLRPAGAVAAAIDLAGSRARRQLWSAVPRRRPGADRDDRGPGGRTGPRDAA